MRAWPIISARTLLEVEGRAFFVPAPDDCGNHARVHTTVKIGDVPIDEPVVKQIAEGVRAGVPQLRRDSLPRRLPHTHGKQIRPFVVI